MPGRDGRGPPHSGKGCVGDRLAHYSVHVSTDATPEPTEAAPDALDLSTPAPAGEPTPASTRPARRAVVAEDEALIRMDVVETLRDAGFDVVGEAGDGEQAVQLVTDLKPDVVVMDVKMPVLDGISAAERIGKAHLAPVVLLTAFCRRSWWSGRGTRGPWPT